MQGLPQLVDRCTEDFIRSFIHDWVPDESGAEYAYQYGEAILKNLDDFETELRAELRRRITPRLRQRNTCLPISKLPPELLQLIFRFDLITYSGDRARGYIWKMVVLRSVSWEWRTLLDRSAFLWGHIASSDHPDFISKALENSKEAPLHLNYSRNERDGSHSAFLDKMLHHLHRLESIEIDNPTHEVFAKYFTSRAPLLKRMALRERSELELHHLIPPFSGSWTALEELRIRHWPDIEWKEVQFGQLRVVDIYYCRNLELSLIFRLIQENQHLEILRLQRITFTSSTSLTHSNTPVVLSHLKGLTLSKLRFADSSNVNNHPHHPTLHILYHIRFPSCTKLALRTSIKSESTIDPQDLRSVLPSPLDILAHPSPNDPQTSQKPRGHLTATFSTYGLSLNMGQEPGCEFEYKVDLDYTPKSITRRWLKSALEDRPGVTLQEFKLRVSVERISQMDDLVAFQSSEAVTRLWVGIRAGPLREEAERRLLQILATPCTSASGATVMAFPRLLSLEVNGWEGRGEAVLEMIRNRFSTPGVEAHRPDSIIIKSYRRDKKFLWDSLDEVRKLDGFEAIHFGAIDHWPSGLQTMGSRTPESLRRSLNEDNPWARGGSWTPEALHFDWESEPSHLDWAPEPSHLDWGEEGGSLLSVDN